MNKFVSINLLISQFFNWPAIKMITVNAAYNHFGEVLRQFYKMSLFFQFFQTHLFHNYT